MKAYSTRVGSGPYPTELLDGVAAGIAERGREVGTVTGRARRIGWFDAVPLRYAVAVNSVSSIMLNKLDILSGVDPLRICVAYEIDGRRVETWPSSGAALSRATPIYEEFDGWDEPIHAVRSLGDLPENARRYVTAIESHAGVPIVLVSVGPGADPDDRARLSADAPPAGDPGVSGGRVVMPTRILIVGEWRSRARPRLAAERGAGREHGVRRARQRRHRRGAAGAAAGRCRSARWCVGRRGRPRSRRGARGHRAGGAAGGRGRGRARGGGHRRLRTDRRRGPDRDEQGVLPRGRRGGRRADGALGGVQRRPPRPAPSPSGWLPMAGASSSRRTGSPPARA